MTEDEAKTKICPQSFAVPEVRGSDGSGIQEGGPWFCRASGCMAWRVLTISAHQEIVNNRAETPDGEGWKPATTRRDNHSWWRTVPEQHVGYCGLAGQP